MRQSSRNGVIAFFASGIALVVTDHAAGWAFFILGLTYLARSTEQGSGWSNKNPLLTRVILIAITVLALLIAGLLIARKYLGP